MSKLNELKKQNPNLNINYIDAISLICPKTKYVELFVNLFKNNDVGNESRDEILNILKNEYGLGYELFYNLSNIQLINYYRFYNEILGGNVKIFREFIDFNERNLIEKNDLTSYKSFDELTLQVSLANIKNDAKLFEAQIIKLFEDDEWLVLKPLSYEASKKYGANTKWCTTSESDPDYFFKYVKTGILIYTINKKSGNKIAVFKDFNTTNADVSFWDIKDNRIDSLFADLSENVLKCIKNEIYTCDITNWGLLSDEDKTKYAEKYLDKIQKRYITDVEEVFDEAQNIPVERVVRYQYAPPVTTQTIQVNINIDDLNDQVQELDDQVQETVNNITNKYLYRENTPQVREDLLDELKTIFGDDVYLE